MAAGGKRVESTLSNDARSEEPSAHHSHLAGFRPLFEAVVCLALAVTLFRTFAIEGYVISTGSMAPNLLGYHKRIVCPACAFSFAFGVAYDQKEPAQAFVACPNCGRARIDVAAVPPSVGDQLLVHKHVFAFKAPRRWEVVVFQNPNKPTQAYVKRLVGLPGDRLQIIGGDVYVHGKIQRKNLTQQRGIRIPVYDFDHRPRDDENWKPRWIAQPGWHRNGDGYDFVDSVETTNASEPPMAWVAYRHWIRSGGSHETSVPLDRWPQGLDIPNSVFAPLYYNSLSRRLVCVGTLPSDLHDRLLARTDDPLLTRAIRQLDEQSHLSPITDVYGYNRPLGSSAAATIRDLMLSARVTIRGGDGQFTVQMADGDRVLSCVFDAGAGMVGLVEDGNTQPIRTAPLPPRMLERSVLLEMSIFDRQVLLAVDGETLFGYPIQSAVNATANSVENDSRLRNAPEGDTSRQLTLRQPVRIGARGLNLSINSLKLFRDVHYTVGGGRNGVDEPFALGDDEYFFLGDNSPVSLDSRSWPNGTVSSRMFLGKPLVVHLPSRPGKIRIGNYVGYIRIPDVSRIRYIR